MGKAWVKIEEQTKGKKVVKTIKNIFKVFIYILLFMFVALIVGMAYEKATGKLN